jgi:transcriptional regulator with XRE-family HTH domain
LDRIIINIGGMNLKTLGDSLRNAREGKNLTQKEVSKKTGINNKTISNYENDVSLPDPNTLKTFADIYETSVDYLLGRPDNKENLSGREDKKSLDVSGLPDEAIRQAEEYIGLLRLKFKSNGTK